MPTAPPSAFWRQIKVLLPVYLNVFMLGCTIGWTPNAIYFMNEGKEVSANSEEISLIVSGAEIGCLLMSIPTGALANKFSRRSMIIATSILHFFSWLALSINSSILTIFLVRVSLGVAISLETATGLITIGELASPEIRAKLTAIYQQFFLLGQGFEIFISLLFSSYFNLSYYTLATSALVLSSLYWVLETPNYLISVSRDEKALKNLKYLRYGKSDDEINTEFDNIKNYIEREKKQKLQTNWFKFVKSEEIGKPLLTVFAITFFTLASGYCVLRSYITIMVPENEFISKKYYPLFRYILSDIGIVLLLPLYVERFPRRILFMSGAMGLTLFYVLLATTYFFYAKFANETCKWIFTLGYFSIGVLVTGLIRPMLFSLKGEILPHHMKGFGGTLGVIAEALASIILFQIFNVVFRKFGLHYNFIIYGVNSLILFFLVNYLVLECRGKYLSQIQNEIIGNKENKTKLVEAETKCQIQPMLAKSVPGCSDSDMF